MCYRVIDTRDGKVYAQGTIRTAALNLGRAMGCRVQMWSFGEWRTIA